MKQISLTIPDALFAASKGYIEEFGYKNMQEFILDVVRNTVFWDRLNRYSEIEDRMRKGGVKRLSQEEASKYLKGF